MSTLSAGIVNIALPTMSAQFQVDLDHIQLVVSMYLLVLTCLLPVFGKRPIFTAANGCTWADLSVFGVGALIGALSKSLGMMLLARAVQGIGSSAMMATSQALIAQIFHGKSRGKAFGGHRGGGGLRQFGRSGHRRSLNSAVGVARQYFGCRYRYVLLAYGEGFILFPRFKAV